MDWSGLAEVKRRAHANVIISFVVCEWLVIGENVRVTFIL